MTPTETLDARIYNERLKLFASLLNALAAAALIGSVIGPIVSGSLKSPFWSTLVAGFGGVLHLIAQLVLDFFKPEQ